MLRFGILSSVVPLILAGGGIVHDWTAVATQSCTAAGISAASIRPVTFTTDPSLATVKVQVIDGADLADLAIADDVDTAEAEGCGISDLARHVTIGSHPLPGEPIIHLSRDGAADYRIYVDSTKITLRQAAALVVSAHGGHARFAAATF
ncbi:hypothetical protein [Bradyrhizobium sp. LHD-71]|uniref:hypothetical protein n=1 Tax=Bradyrhizobium sp. LHD-71 TaxID=3072141 RepID=UPI00280CE96B|nr:hypothetical protein [Bradyrhizobium sp. LHD-71]MDQ8732191.1 hypothetical protein [Bradyrhizobium sp. LHD-71]